MNFTVNGSMCKTHTNPLPLFRNLIGGCYTDTISLILLKWHIDVPLNPLCRLPTGILA
jgi:hypothetical protein